MDFRTAAVALKNYVPNSYDLIAAADAIVFAENPPSPDPEPLAPWEKELLGHNSDHIKRVDLALSEGHVIGLMLAHKKILAIKEVRRITGTGLKEAKEAIEDARVTAHVQTIRDTYNNNTNGFVGI